MRNQRTARAVAALAVAFAVFGVWAGVAQAADQLGFVASQHAKTIQEVDLTAGAVVGAPIAVGLNGTVLEPVALAVTPDGSTAFVVDSSDESPGSSAIVPVALATGVAGTPIEVPGHILGIAISPTGRLAYVVSDNGTEWPITLSTGRVGNPLGIPSNTNALAITPDGLTEYITNAADGTLTQLTLANGATAQPINLSATTPDGVAISPDGSTAYVASHDGGSLTPVYLTGPAANTSGTAIPVGSEPTSVALTADGTTAYVTNFNLGEVTPVTLATATTTAAAGTPIPVGPEPSAIALVPPGGITTAPPGTYGNLGGNGSPQTTLGNQQVTVTVAQPAGAACHASKSTLTVTVKRRVLGHGAHLTLRDVTFKLGSTVKVAKRFPATARFPLKAYHTGSYTVSVRIRYTERVVRVTRQKKRILVTVTISRTLKTRFNVC